MIKVPEPCNEPVRPYSPGSKERERLQTAIAQLKEQKCRVPIVIGGRAVRSGETASIRCPHDHSLQLGDYDSAGSEHAEAAIRAALDARAGWGAMPWRSRAAVFLKAAALAAGPWRDRLNAATVLGQSKTPHQAEIDAACELVDFFRFNVFFAEQLHAQQPLSSGVSWNYQEYRPLDGFVFAVTPFNFTAIAANLPTAPALMGNTVIWKPSERSVLSSHVVMELLIEAGLPGGVINFLPSAKPGEVGSSVLADPNLAGIHFTGSTQTFNHLWREVANHLERYRNYPRLVGETGGKDFVFAHPSAAVEPLVTALVRGAFEYQGQKCSAASRGYIPGSLWEDVVNGLERRLDELPVGPPCDFRNFMGAVIDRRAYEQITGRIEAAKSDPDYRILLGGDYHDDAGYFIQPTVIATRNPAARLLTEELFGPVLTLYRYEDECLEQALSDLDEGTPYALTGAVFARDRAAIEHLSGRLRQSAGNFYINDKPTGAVVGQQPFGGARKSGTNDKAGSTLNLLRWVSVRTVKENFVPDTECRYPHMGERSDAPARRENGNLVGA